MFTVYFVNIFNKNDSVKDSLIPNNTTDQNYTFKRWRLILFYRKTEAASLTFFINILTKTTN